MACELYYLHYVKKFESFSRIHVGYVYSAERLKFFNMKFNGMLSEEFIKVMRSIIIINLLVDSCSNQ